MTWQFYHSPAEMETALNEAAMRETDDNSLHFLYYTFPMTENDYALDLYHMLKRKFDTDEYPLSAWSADNGKLFFFLQETLKVGCFPCTFHLRRKRGKKKLLIPIISIISERMPLFSPPVL